MLACFFQIYFGGSGTWSMLFSFCLPWICNKNTGWCNSPTLNKTDTSCQVPSYIFGLPKMVGTTSWSSSATTSLSALSNPRIIHNPSPIIVHLQQKHRGKCRYHKKHAKAYALMVKKHTVIKKQWKTTRLVNITYPMKPIMIIQNNHIHINKAKTFSSNYHHHVTKQHVEGTRKCKCSSEGPAAAARAWDSCSPDPLDLGKWVPKGEDGWGMVVQKVIKLFIHIVFYLCIYIYNYVCVCVCVSIVSFCFSVKQ